MSCCPVPAGGGSRRPWAALLLLAAAVPAQGQAPEVRITVRTGTLRPISRLVYGLNLLGDPTWGQVPRNVAFSRFGGNRLTAYNWENNFSNAGSDWNYSNDSLLSESRVPGAAVKQVADRAFAAGAAVAVTVPMAGWVSGDGDGPVPPPHPSRARFIPSFPAARPGVRAGPDTKDDGVYQADFVRWLERTYPGAAAGGQPRLLFILDNEPELWHVTHKELWGEVAVTWRDLVARTVGTAVAIKDVVPGARVFGPDLAGWTGIVNLQGGARPPGSTHRYFIDYYLEELRAAGKAQKRRLLDVLDVHWYTEVVNGKGERIRDRVPETEDTIRARVQAPRSLWDPAFIESSWITRYGTIPECGTCAIELIPRLRRHVAERYPGTEIAITERFYGGAAYPSGAVAEADALGILGREGVYAAAPFPLAGPYDCLFAGWRAFLDHDGAGGRFGDASAPAEVHDPRWTPAAERVSAYASADPAADRVVVVALNKTLAPIPAGFRVEHARRLERIAQYRVAPRAGPTEPGCSGPDPVPAPPLEGDAFQASLPALSISVFVLRP